MLLRQLYKYIYYYKIIKYGHLLLYVNITVYVERKMLSQHQQILLYTFCKILPIGIFFYLLTSRSSCYALSKILLLVEIFILLNKCKYKLYNKYYYQYNCIFTNVIQTYDIDVRVNTYTTTNKISFQYTIIFKIVVQIYIFDKNIIFQFIVPNKQYWYESFGVYSSFNGKCLLLTLHIPTSCTGIKV